jgi:hypothetical protein
VFAEQRAGALHAHGRLGQTHRRAGRAHVPQRGVGKIDDELTRLNVRIARDLIDPIEHTARHASLFEESVPVLTGLGASYLLDELGKLQVARPPIRDRGEARMVLEVL